MLTKKILFDFLWKSKPSFFCQNMEVYEKILHHLCNCLHLRMSELDYYVHFPLIPIIQ